MTDGTYPGYESYFGITSDGYISDAPFDLDAPIPFGRAVVGNENRALIANTGPGTHETPTLIPATAPGARAEPVRVW
jgi:hypothetical protein